MERRRQKQVHATPCVPETGRQSYVSGKRLDIIPLQKFPINDSSCGSQNLLPHHRSTQTWTHHHSLKCLCIGFGARISRKNLIIGTLSKSQNVFVRGSQNLLYTTEEPSYGQIIKVANVFTWMEVRTIVPSRLAMPPFATDTITCTI
jgi:hypothetical protein